MWSARAFLMREINQQVYAHLNVNEDRFLEITGEEDRRGFRILPSGGGSSSRYDAREGELVKRQPRI